MATRKNSAIYFGNINFTSSNENKRWYIDANKYGGAPFSASEGAAIITDMFAASGFLQSDDVGFNTGEFESADPSGTGTVTVGVRLPQTYRLLNLVTQGITLPVGASYSVYVSGRADKMFTEITDWVKVASNDAARLESDVSGFIPNSTKITSVANQSNTVLGGLGLNAGDLTIYNGSTWSILGPMPSNVSLSHLRFFPYMTAWVKLVFEGIDTDQMSLSRVFFNGYEEDANTGEDDPAVTMVYPRSNKDWLPSQTIFATARIDEPNGDACHFGIEVYKESGTSAGSWTISGGGLDTEPGVFGSTTGDHLMMVAESNALNLDGTPNENYSRTWYPLGDVTPNAMNQIYLKEDIGAVKSFLIVPIEVANNGTIADITNIKFYKNEGNELLLDVVVDGTGKLVVAQPFNDITIPTTVEGRKTAQGWVIQLKDGTGQAYENGLTGINRIDIINSVTQSKVVTKVEIFYCSATLGWATPLVSNLVVEDNKGVWRPNGSTATFQHSPWVANIEFCFPKTSVYTSGYLEGTSVQLDEETNNEYNPTNNGYAFDQVNPGDWPVVPKYAGLILNENADLGDSPVASAQTGLAAAVPADPARSVYIRMALPDPYQDGDRFYVRAYVWDGRTKVVS